MRSILFIAGLTLQEASRKRVFLGALVIIVLFLGMMQLASSRERRPGPRRARQQAAQQQRPDRDTTQNRFRLPPNVQAAIVADTGFGAIKFFGSVLAIIVVAGAISTEIERGTLPVVLARPVRRWQVLLGKWLGSAAIIAINIAVWTVLVWLSARSKDPGGVYVGLFRCGAVALLYPLVFMTLTLLFSTFASNALAAVLGFVGYGVATQETSMRGFAVIQDLPSLNTFADIVRYAVPTTRVGQWMDDVDGMSSPLSNMGPQRFVPVQDVTSLDLWYVGLWMLGVLIVGAIVFHRRDI